MSFRLCSRCKLMQPAHRTLLFSWDAISLKKGANVFQIFKCSKQTVKSDKFPAKECACKWPSLGSQRGPQRCLRGLQESWNTSLHIKRGIFLSRQKTEILWSDAFCLFHMLVPFTFILAHSKWRFVPFLPMQLPPPQWGEVLRRCTKELSIWTISIRCSERLP